MADTATGQVAYAGYREAVSAIYRDEGVRGFYKGMSASYWGCSEGCLYFVLYERIKRYIGAVICLAVREGGKGLGLG